MLKLSTLSQISEVSFLFSAFPEEEHGCFCKKWREIMVPIWFWVAFLHSGCFVLNIIYFGITALAIIRPFYFIRRGLESERLLWFYMTCISRLWVSCCCIGSSAECQPCSLAATVLCVCGPHDGPGAHGTHCTCSRWPEVGRRVGCSALCQRVIDTFQQSALPLCVMMFNSTLTEQAWSWAAERRPRNGTN